GEADSPFAERGGGGMFMCLCGEIFSQAEQSVYAATAEKNRQ
ncbi:MAG: hypothetical protein H6Q93_201, partial [Nitrospirae bacterium]|nr:hypothetical protein [Nitrospirota bacterium]